MKLNRARKRFLIIFSITLFVIYLHIGLLKRQITPPFVDRTSVAVSENVNDKHEDLLSSAEETDNQSAMEKEFGRLSSYYNFSLET